MEIKKFDFPKSILNYNDPRRRINGETTFNFLEVKPETNFTIENAKLHKDRSQKLRLQKVLDQNRESENSSKKAIRGVNLTNKLID